ncbi:MAG: outer membrane beta-barrel protein [Planctomycetes bacterium]|nr:outer membrane beta-barrel protein [Planctomycetota bacterium]
MSRHLSLLVLGVLGACASTGTSTPGVARSTLIGSPTLSGSLPPAPAALEQDGAPKDTTLPFGVGFTTGPSTFLLSTTLDFPLDKRITVGPSLQYGFDDSVKLTAVTAQLKYYFDAIGERDSFSFLPYATAGFGFANIDKEGRGADSGALVNIGAGVRYLTGDHYRIGSEARINYLPDDLGGENSYLSFDVLQVVISF